ncbi:hypothetical protein M9434_004768 [Picochlorum sp. BPE23]|nr:hypothetical protein M9434_004768 [Picochlorum sp. BPE23]
MVKQRMSTADIGAEVGSLRKKGLLGMRVTNVYDIGPKLYALRLARSGEDGEKAILLIESGVRLHTIDEMPEKSDVPSNFTLKLRKHIRSRRLEDIKQLGSDRVVQLTFGTGDLEVKLLLEFYASGNIILADSKYQVLSLLRSHRDDAKGIGIMSQHAYPIQTIRLRSSTSLEAVEQALSSCSDSGLLKDAVTPMLGYGPQVSNFCIQHAGLNVKRKPAQEPLSEGEKETLLQSIRMFEKWIDSCEDKAPKGCIFVSSKHGYNDFQPCVHETPLVQHDEMEMIQFPSFDDAAREFYSKIEGDRESVQIMQREEAAQKKLEAIRKQHKERIENLSREIDAAEQKALVLQSNLDKVDAAIESVREGLAAGISWKDLGEMIEMEKDAGNPVAELIHSLKLEKNTIALSLFDPDVEKMIVIDVDISLTAHANVSAYYDLKKKHTEKARRTIESNDKALAAAESKVLVKLEKIQKQKSKASESSQAPRKPYWFEKFHWFISSENYLVVSGRDAQQNELLVKRYLQKGDVYVHAELHGASSTIVKNNNPTQPIPLMTLNEAGQACVARSAAWDAKIVASAYWVYPEQVSKTAPSGEYLTTGSMMIRGRKNYLPPQPQVMGIGWLFKLEQGSIAAHLGERAPRSLVPDSMPSHAMKERPHNMEHEEDASAAEPTSALEKFLNTAINTDEDYTIVTSKSAKGKPSHKEHKKKPAQHVIHEEQEEEEEEEEEAPPQAPKRGKHKKKALKKKKYQDQDEEERELAMALLQPDGQKKSKDRKERKKERKARMAARKAQASGIQAPEITEDAIQNLTARLDLHDSSSSNSEDEEPIPHEEESVTSAVVHENDIPPSEHNQHHTKKEEKEKENIEELLQEEGVSLLNEEEMAKMTMLDELTGIPTPSDTILAAIPVCAPYSVASSYKYHVKLVPGTQKKGKAYRQAVDVIASKFKATPQHVELRLIKAIPEQEGINAMIGSVKLQVAGLQKLHQAKKKNKGNKK